jgi:hypothetical protein
MTTWVILEPIPGEGATHFPPRCVCEKHHAESLVAAWAERLAVEEPDGILSTVRHKETSEAWLDLGGIIQINRKIYTLKPIDGRTLTVPAGHVEGYLSMLKTRGERAPEELGGMPFYTLPSMHLRILLSLSQCDTLARILSEISIEADAIATIENDFFNKSIADSDHMVAPKRPTGRISNE